MSPCEGSCRDGADVCPCPSHDTGDTPYWQHSNASGSPQLSGTEGPTWSSSAPAPSLTRSPQGEGEATRMRDRCGLQPLEKGSGESLASWCAPGAVLRAGLCDTSVMATVG